MSVARRERKSPLEKMARETVLRNEALQALLLIHRCNSRPGITVGECVKDGLCRCSCELFVASELSASPPPDAAGNRGGHRRDS